jgi:hypothetical protein
MSFARLYFRDGVSPANAAKILSERITAAGHILGSATGAALIDGLRDRYLDWAEATEIQLRGMTFDPEVLTMLHTSRYWYIRGLDMASARPWSLVRAEIDSQVDALRRLVDDLEDRVKRLSGAPGHITVLDTNVLLHYKPPAEIPWPRVVQRLQVRLVVPLRVVEELDAKKYSNKRPDLAKRARSLLPQLESVIGRTGAPGDLLPNVTIEVPLDPGRGRRPTDADEEVLQNALSTPRAGF